MCAKFRARHCTLQKKIKNLTLTVREFNKRIVQQVLIELAINSGDCW
jgi:hypothetical protein